MDLNINLNVSGKIDHVHHVGELATSINHLRSTLMALGDDLKALIASIDAATNKVADRITALIAQIKPQLSDQEVADIKSGLQAEADKLTAIGSNPDNPIPTP